MRIAFGGGNRRIGWTRSEPRHNELITGWPEPLRRLMTAEGQRVTLHRHQQLFRSGDRLDAVYFPETSLVSLMASLGTGELLEAGLVGFDGMVGTYVLPGAATTPCDAVVQIAGTALRANADAIRRHVAAHPDLRREIERCAHVALTASMQAAVCVAFHSAESRCVRWLLTAADLTRSDDLPVTQYQLAELLGLQRPTVSLIMHTLSARGCIESRRGGVRLVDPSRLLPLACECYGLSGDERGRLMEIRTARPSPPLAMGL
jgi:CRP-like cAMP-binding protein